MIIRADLEGRLLSVSPRMCELLGYREDELLGATSAHFTHPDDQAPSAALVAEIAAGTKSRMEITKRYLHRDGTVLWANAEVSLDHGADGEPVIVAVIQDLTERRRTEQLLSLQAAVIDASNDVIGMADLEGKVQWVNRRGCELCGIEPARVPDTTISDWASTETWELLRDTGLPTVLTSGRWEGEGALCHFGSGEQIEVDMSVFRISDPDSEEPRWFAAIVREIGERRRLERARLHAEQLRGLMEASVAINSERGVESMLTVLGDRAKALVGARYAAIDVAIDGLDREQPPAGSLVASLVAQSGMRIGQIRLWDKPDAAFEEGDEAILGQLAQLASVAIEKAWLFERERHIAETLQRSLLPERLPTIEGVDLASRYRPAGEGIDVGGDFYDVFDTGDSSWGVVVGDVCGKGADAAAVTALARHTVRAASLQGAMPAEVLRRLNDAVIHHRADNRFCTVAFARMQLVDGGARVTIASGGHPLPLLVRSDGGVSRAGSAGTLLGCYPDPVLAEHTVELGSGDALVFYTDGLTDAWEPRRSIGEAELKALLEARRDDRAAAILDGLEAAVLDGEPQRPRDDLALLVVKVDPAGRRVLRRRLAANDDAARHTRRLIAELELEPALGEDANLLASELVTNAVRHGGAATELVDVEVELCDDHLRLEVRDAGSGFNPPPYFFDAHRTSGWGLMLVDRIADRWGARHEYDGTRAWFELDRRPPSPHNLDMIVSRF